MIFIVGVGDIVEDLEVFYEVFDGEVGLEFFGVDFGFVFFC